MHRWEPSPLLAFIAGALPGAIAIESCCIDEASEDLLHPDEFLVIANAVAKRRKEFVAGRVAARRALKRLGYAYMPIPVGSQREPIWPEGIIGSITHEGDYAISAVAQKKDISFLGIDLASRDALGDELISIICREDEIKDIQRQKRHFDGDSPFKLVFSIKESVYKCLFPVVRTVFDFHDVSVKFTHRKEGVDVQIVLDNHLLFSRVTGRLKVAFLYVGNYVFTSVWSAAPRANL